MAAIQWDLEGSQRNWDSFFTAKVMSGQVHWATQRREPMRHDYGPEDGKYELEHLMGSLK